VNAILPAAGKGTRMSLVTGGASKELLMVAGRPVMQWGLDEAFDSGATHMSVISSPIKGDLNEFLTAQPPNVTASFQFAADGLAPAIALGARPEPTLVILPDTLYYPSQPGRRIVRALAEGYDIVLLTEIVADEAVSQYGIVELADDGMVERVVEKPQPGSTRSRQAVAGRYGLSPRMIGFLANTLDSLRDEVGEIPLTPIINLAIRNGYEALALPTVEGEIRWDCGDPDGYRRAVESIS